MSNVQIYPLKNPKASRSLFILELNKDSNKIEAIVHRPKDVSKLQQELKDMGEDEDLSYEYVEDDEDVEDLEDFEYEEEDWEDDKQ